MYDYNFFLTCLILGFFSVIFASSCLAQHDTLRATKPQLRASGSIDAYYSYDFQKPQLQRRQNFLYNHNRHNEFNINTAVLKLNAEGAYYKANFAIVLGTYAEDNYAAEPDGLNKIMEANISLALSKNKKLWLDVGIMPSHIGFESAISMDNPTLMRSLSAENSPYFISGIMLSYHNTEKWTFATLLTNGWQRIQRLEGNSLLSFGTQITYKPNEKTVINWSTYLSSEYPDDQRKMRYFNNMYAKFHIMKHIYIISGIDIGIEQL